MTKIIGISAGLLLILLFQNCAKEYDCSAFDLEQPILKISVSTDLKDSLLFESDNGEQIILVKHVFEISDADIERCGGMDLDCNCMTRMEIRYWDNSSDYYCGFEIRDDIAVDNSYHLTDYSFFSHKIFRHYYNIDYDNIDSFIDSLSTDQIELDGEIYSNIVEFSDSTTDLNYINKFWIKPEIGLFKFWENGNCWTLVE